jgi:hypothetical protein
MASVGVEVAETSAVGMEDLLRLADTQMYRVKGRGKNGVAVRQRAGACAKMPLIRSMQ